MQEPDEDIKVLNKQNRKLAATYIEQLEEGTEEGDIESEFSLNMINSDCKKVTKWIRKASKRLLKKGKIVGIIGGDHSSPLGLIEALSEQYKSFGILQLDAHMDLRKAYEGFIYSHASIFYNALQLKQISKLVQVGIRDCCQEEISYADNSGDRIEVHFDQAIKSALFEGYTFDQIAKNIINSLPQNVYVSFDIDVLDPSLCPHTGTPVPGGLDFNQAVHILDILAKSGRSIIGFDLCEVAGSGHEWDGNVGARLAYKLSNLTAYSQGLTAK